MGTTRKQLEDKKEREIRKISVTKEKIQHFKSLIKESEVEIKELKKKLCTERFLEYRRRLL